MFWFSPIWAWLDVLGDGRVTGGGGDCVVAAVEIGFVWHTRLVNLAEWVLLGQRRWRGRMLSKVLMQIGCGEIGFVCYFRLAGLALGVHSNSNFY